MMPKVDSNHGGNSGNVVETNFSTENGEIIAANVKKINQKKETSKRKSNSNAKCEVKGKKLNLDKQNESGDNITEKKKKKKINGSSDRAPRRTTKKHKNLEDRSHDSSHHVCQVQASSDDDIELTVEDLMAIAEQYIKDYEDKEPQETTSGRYEPKWQFPATTEAGTTHDSACENKKSSSLEREALYNSAPTTGEVIRTSTSLIGHPAQDMLDVFLGPLLRTTIEKEENWRRENLS